MSRTPPATHRTQWPRLMGQSSSLCSFLCHLPAGLAFSFITVHCSATSPQQDIGEHDIRRWHKNRGWRDVGDHFVIRRDGKVELGRAR
ncbi:hypothetical protein VCHA41O245_100029 [Vibrio chagasii]|nr:hypothetical protein VCHA41O245_100029 [Vibrio chagasii]